MTELKDMPEENPMGEMIGQLLQNEFDKLKAENLRLRDDLAERGWGTIESAPRDGTVILVTDGSDVVTACGLYTGENFSGWAMTYDGGRIVCDVRDEYEMIYGVTHWQPLPQPPKDEAQS